MNILKVITSNGQEDFFELVGNVVSIGSDEECSITINDPDVSSSHARLIWNGSAFLIEGLSPENPIFVNGIAVEGMRQMAPGEIISLGSSIVIFSPVDLVANSFEKKEKRNVFGNKKNRKVAASKYKDLDLQEKEIKSLCNTSFFCSIFGLFGLFGLLSCTLIAAIFIPFSFYYAKRAMESTRSCDLSLDKKNLYLKRARVAKTVAWISMGLVIASLLIGITIMIIYA